MKKILFRALLFLLGATAIFSVLGYFGQRNWFIDLFSHFKVQYLIILTIGTLIISLMRKRVALVFTPFIIALCIEIAPLYFGGDQNKNVTESRKIVCVNLLSSNTQFEEVGSFVDDNSPDIIVLQEFTDRWQAMLEPKLKAYKYRLTLPRNDNFGMAVYSKVKLFNLQELKIGRAGVPSISADFSLGTENIRLIATHVLPPVGTGYFEHRNTQLSEIARFISRLKDKTVLIGDFNTSSFSSHFKDLIDESGLLDSRKGFGLLPTWPTYFSLMQTTLDHCLLSPGLIVESRGTGPDIGSDHLPILIEVGLQQ